MAPTIPSLLTAPDNMHVLMISDVYFPRINGVSTSIATFRECLRALGVRVSLVVPDYPSPAGARDDPTEGALQRVPSRRVPFDPEDRLMSPDRSRAAIAAIHATQPIDLIHVHTPFVAHGVGLSGARRQGIPVVATYHTLFEEYFHHYLPLAPRCLTRAIARHYSRRQCNELDAVVVPSGAMRDRLNAYGVRVPTHVIPTGIPLDRFTTGNREGFRKHIGAVPQQPVALFVGRVAHEKNIGFLIDALQAARTQRPDTLLVIAGEGPALADLKALAKQRGLEAAVRFVGYLERNTALPACYAAADAFVFASRTETQGLVLLEALAMGLPVVALSAMGTSDLLERSRGAIVPPDDPIAFGHALATLFADRERLRRLGEEAREYAREWSDMAMAVRMRSLYRSLVDRY